MPDSGSRFLHRLTSVVLVLAALVTAQAGIRWAMSRSAGPAHHGSWIWSPHLTAWQRGGSFYAIRDFDLTSVPRHARIWVQGDEEYTLRVNGVRVGSNRYDPDGGLDHYDVSGLLEPGQNRIVAQLVTTRGLGGFLAVLEAEAMEPIGTDAEWRIAPAWEPGLFDGALPLDRYARARVWDRPPAGRWGAPRPGAELPLFEDLSLDTTRPWKYRPWGIDDWRRSGRRILGPLAGAPGVELRWRTDETGYLVLQYRPGLVPTGLVWAGVRRPNPRRDPPAGFVIGIPGRAAWAMSRPMTIRHVVVAGVDGLLDATIVRVREDLAGELLFEPSPPAGVAGLEPPRLRSPLEDEIWRELEGFASP